MSDTMKSYGNNLLTASGVAQPGGTVVFDGTGLVQAQMTFAIDTDYIAGAISYYEGGQNYPNLIGVTLTSYKCHIQSSKGEVSMLTVDYIGVRGSHSIAQITGISNTSAQPIESHPTFTDFAGYADTASSWLNNAMFSQKNLTDENGGTSTQYQFIGFGCTKQGEERNIKAGIRQYLKPMQSIRGTIIFAGDSGEPGDMAQGVGKRLSGGGVNMLIPNTNVTGAIGGDYCLLTAVNVEPIGVPDDPAVMKVVYDIMISGNDKWDDDIYEVGY